MAVYMAIALKPINVHFSPSLNELLSQFKQLAILAKPKCSATTALTPCQGVRRMRLTIPMYALLARPVFRPIWTKIERFAYVLFQCGCHVAVYSLTDRSFLLNHLFDSQVLFPFEKSLRKYGFGHASWRLFVYIPDKLVRKEVPGSIMTLDAQEHESISGIKSVHAPTPHRLVTPASVRVGSWSPIWKA